MTGRLFFRNFQRGIPIQGERASFFGRYRHGAYSHVPFTRTNVTKVAFHPRRFNPRVAITGVFHVSVAVSVKDVAARGASVIRRDYLFCGNGIGVRLQVRPNCDRDFVYRASAVGGRGPMHLQACQVVFNGGVWEIRGGRSLC